MPIRFSPKEIDLLLATALELRGREVRPDHPAILRLSQRLQALHGREIDEQGQAIRPPDGMRSQVQKMHRVMDGAKRPLSFRSAWESYLRQHPDDPQP